MKPGKVYLVGAGPAGIDYLTVKGLRILHKADTVIYDYLVDQELLVEAKPDAELIGCDQLGKKCHGNGYSEAQDKINALMVRKAKEGSTVVRLKNGDPMIFARTYDELAVLRENEIEYEIIPGITAAQAAAAITGIPLTDRKISSSVVLVTGHESSEKNRSAIDWKSIAGVGTIVLYMAVKNIRSIVSELLTYGKPADTPALAVSNAGRNTQKIRFTRLIDIPGIVENGEISSPAVFIIGETAVFSKT